MRSTPSHPSLSLVVRFRSLGPRAGHVQRRLPQRAMPSQFQDFSDARQSRGHDSEEEGMVTMAVADLGEVRNSGGVSLSHKLVPPVHKPNSSDNGSQVYDEILLNGDAQRRLDDFVHSAGAPSTVVVSMKEQELQQVKSQLAIRDKEIDQLKAQLAEKDARLRTARSDLMEAKSAEAEQRSKLVQVYELLAETRSERARLADELIQTRVELSDTRRELEELADEILSMKDFVLSAEEANLFDATLTAALQTELESEESNMELYESRHEENESTLEKSITKETNDNPAWIAAAQNLVELSRQIVNDAKIDEHVFSGAGWLKGITDQFERKRMN